MKYLLPICIFIILSTNVFATQGNIFDNLVSTDRNANNAICDNGEFPVLDSDCNNKHDFFFAGWFWKTLLAGILFILAFSPEVLKTKVFWGLFIIFMIFVYFISHQTVTTKNETLINTTYINATNGSFLILPESSFEKSLNTIADIPKKVAGDDNEAFGLFVCIVALFLVIPIVKTAFKKIEVFISK